MSSESLLPKDTEDTAAVFQLSSLPPSDFAAVVPSLLPFMVWRNGPKPLTREPLIELFVSRLTVSAPSPNDPLVSAIISALATPAMTTAAADLKRSLLQCVLSVLPKDRIEPYRAALGRLVTSPTEAETAKGPWPPLGKRSADLLEFLDASHAWVPRHKGDDLGMRSLELIQTAEEMRPYVKRMLVWLQDYHWPPMPGCSAQLARFPELALDPIREILRMGDDGEWSCHLLEFLKDSMPGQLREKARVEVERIAQRPTQSEIDNETSEVAVDCLKAMDDWLARAKILSNKRLQ